MVRGLALRSLCSLRVDNIAEYVMQPIRTRLNDPNPYVRKTAVLGVSKLFLTAPEAVKSEQQPTPPTLARRRRSYIHIVRVSAPRQGFTRQNTKT